MIREKALGALSVLLLLFFFFLAMPKVGYSEEGRGVNVVPDKEKRSCIQTVDGYAYLSEDMTLGQTRAVAFANAKQQALEMTRTNITSKTKVKDGELEYELIWAETEGAVTILEQKDHGVVDNTRYHVWIKAEVEYGLKRKDPEADAEHMVMDEDAPLTVKVWSSKKKYKKSEKIKIYVKGNRDFYARIVDITADGNIIQLLPNDYRRINFFKAGEVYKIPDQGDHFDLEVTEPFGEDQIVVYASEAPVGEVDMDSVGQGLKAYRGSRESFAAMTRGLSVVGDGTGFVSGAEFYEATWSITTNKD